MTEATPSTPTPAVPANRDPAAIAALPIVRSSAHWFWWIAGLSLLNTVLTLGGTGTQMVVGLGMTLLSDVTFGARSPVGFAIDAAALAFFLVIGRQAARGQLWAFYVGTAVYALDALVYVRFQDWMPVALHALVIYFIVRGVLVLRKGLAGAA